MKKAKVAFPTTEERFDTIISGLAKGDFSPASASATIADIHHANLGEVLDEVESLVPADKQSAFALLRRQYTA